MAGPAYLLPLPSSPFSLPPTGLFPPGWQVLEEVILIKGRCVAALVQDRTCKFYVISPYSPDNRNGDMEALLGAWRFLDKKSEYTFLAADFNGIDKHNPQLWEKFLLQFQCSDVYPELAKIDHSFLGLSSFRQAHTLDHGQVYFFLLYAAWVRSRAERPSVSYTKVVMEVAWTGHNMQFTKAN